MSQEQELQDIQVVLAAVSDGVTQIIARLNTLPTDNPDINDEIANIKRIATEMNDKINAVVSV